MAKNYFHYKSRLKLLKFNILGAREVFYGVELVSTIKNTIQTLLLPDFLKKIVRFWPFFGRSGKFVASIDDAKSIRDINNLACLCIVFI